MVRLPQTTHVPAETNGSGKVVGSARTEQHSVDIPVAFRSFEQESFWPKPDNVDVVGGVGAASGASGANSGNSRQNSQRHPETASAILVTDGAGEVHRIDMGTPGTHRIGGFLIETSGAQPRSGERTMLERAIDWVKAFVQ
jgi:hypothetical protein